MSSATCLLLVLACQDPEPVLLPVEVPLHAEIVAADPVVEDPAIGDVEEGVFQPLRGRRFRIEVGQGGVYSIGAESPWFDVLLAIRDAGGKVLGETWCEADGWLRLGLEASTTYRLDCMSPFGAVGAVTIRLTAAAGPTAKERLSRLQGLLEPRQQRFPGDSVVMGRTWDALGMLHYVLADYRRAHECMERAMAIWTRTLGEDSVMAARGHAQLGAQLKGLGRLDEARQHATLAVELRTAKLGPGHRRTLASRNALGVIEQERHELEAAARQFEQVLEHGREDDPWQRENRLAARHNLAYVRKAAGRNSEARALAERVLADFEAQRGLDSVDVAWPLLMLAGIENALGHHARAEALARRALGIRRRALPEDHTDVATACNDLAITLQRRGRLEEAAQCFAECLRIYQQRLGEHWFVATVLGNLGDCLTALGRLDEAEQRLQQALALFDKLGFDRHPASTSPLLTLAAIARLRGDWERAASLFERAITQRTRGLGPLHPDTLYARSMHGRLLRLCGRLDEAAELYPALLADLLAVHEPDHPEISGVREGSAMLYAARGDGAAAMRMAEASVAGRLRHLAGQLVAASSEDRFADAATLCSAIDVMLALTGGDAAAVDRAFEWQAAQKGLVYRHALRQREQVEQGLTPEQARLRSELESCRAALARLAYAAAPEGGAEHAAKLRALYEQKCDLERSLGASLGATPFDERLDAGDLARSLPADTALVDFRFHRPYRPVQVEAGAVVAPEGPEPMRLLAFVMVAGKLHSQRVDLGLAAPIQSAIVDCLQEIARRRGRAARAEAGPRAAQVLRGLLWDPLVPSLGGSSRVVVVADRELAKVPFAVLQRDDGRYLLETHAFAMAQDPITLLRGLRGGAARHRGAPDLFALGAVDYDGAAAAAARPEPGAVDTATERGGFQDYWPPLNTRGEIEALRALHERRFTGAARTLRTGSGATKAALLGAAPRHQVLHLATHGFFEPAGLPSLWEQALQDTAAAPSGAPRPAAAGHLPGLLAGLVLAAANDRNARADAVLTAEEVQGLDLRGCDLVVLSACETALGELRGGEGMLSLRRAFHEAGAATVISSLWNVLDDSTVRLMGAFYANLWERDLPPLEALRQAQLAMLELNRRRSGGDGMPETWGAFVLSGEWR